MIEIIEGVCRGEGFTIVCRKGIIIPIYKKGGSDKVTNYRGIALISTAYKIYDAILNERLKNDNEEETYRQKFKSDLERAEVPLTTYAYATHNRKRNSKTVR